MRFILDSYKLGGSFSDTIDALVGIGGKRSPFSPDKVGGGLNFIDGITAPLDGEPACLECGQLGRIGRGALGETCDVGLRELHFIAFASGF